MGENVIAVFRADGYNVEVAPPAAGTPRSCNAIILNVDGRLDLGVDPRNDGRQSDER